jgi:hypothetical protein
MMRTQNAPAFERRRKSWRPPDVAAYRDKMHQGGN